jgi:hypothetical protein
MNLYTQSSPHASQRLALGQANSRVIDIVFQNPFVAWNPIKCGSCAVAQKI